jgi:hypothetical protein
MSFSKPTRSVSLCRHRRLPKCVVAIIFSGFSFMQLQPIRQLRNEVMPRVQTHFTGIRTHSPTGHGLEGPSPTSEHPLHPQEESDAIPFAMGDEWLTPPVYVCFI